MGFFAHIESNRRYGSDSHRLVIGRHSPWNRSTDVLMSDGTWETVPEMQKFPETETRTVGIELPMDCVKAIVEAVKEFAGPGLDSSTEVKILREWLTVEKARVEDILLNQTDLIKRAMLDS